MGKPIVYVSTSEGLLTDWEAYAPDGKLMAHEELPVIVVQIDWDDVARDEDLDGAPSVVREWIADERLPERLRKDLQLSYEHARRFDDLEDGEGG